MSYRISQRLFHRLQKLGHTNSKNECNSKKDPLYLIGQGFTNCKIPSFISHHFLGNPHVYTPYTPDQAEISQGRLELLHNYQTMIQNITSMDIAVASMIDNGQVGMDLVSLMKQKTKKSVIYVQRTLQTPLMNCIRTRANHLNIEIRPFYHVKDLFNVPYESTQKIAGVFVQTPDLFGSIVNLSDIEELKKMNSDIIVACHTDLLYLTTHDPQTKYGIDFMFGNGGNLGVGLNYGGPQPAFLATHKKYVRDLPGRIIGESIDTYGRPSYRMALQTREQHIRRERATSNVCTSQALLANMSVAWAMYHGSEGLQKISRHNHSIAKIFVNEISRFSMNETLHNFYDTVAIYTNPSHCLYDTLTRNNIYPYAMSNPYQLIFTFDETHNEDTVERILHYIRRSNIPVFFYVNPNQNVSQRENFTLRTKYNGGNEQTIMRYLHNIQMKDYSLMNGMIPLGSCTMKHTPHEAMKKVMDSSWNVHPYVSENDAPHGSMISSLTKQLCRLSGFDDVFYQSQSGAMGEYAGLTTIKNYLNEPSRNVILMPKSAHGTNAASCVLAGYIPTYVNETEDGMIDMDHFNMLVESCETKLAGLMITYPSTYGLYEENIRPIIDRIHKAGGQVYLDGANMNALVGMETPVANLGFDVCHFNLHKTFCIPHGGGGPGMGPIAVKDHLIPHLPQFSTNTDTTSISTSKYGSGSLLLIPEHYISTKTDEDWKTHHTQLIETTKNVIKQLSQYYTIYHKDSSYRAHEFIINTSELKKKYNINEVDICKRLMDYGFHGPTMSWPISGGLMIEITETEDDTEIQRFVNALISIRGEMKENIHLLTNAPHTQQDLLDWKYEYSIKKACYPSNFQIENKYWPTRNRINDVYGDRQLMKK